jgi:hypothetical protein
MATAPPASNQHVSRDWSLPPAFLALLADVPANLSRLSDDLWPCTTPNQKAATPGSAIKDDAPSHPFIDALKSNPDTFTDKGARAHKSTQSAIVDLFFDFAQGIEPVRVFNLLEAAWKEDPLV